MPWSTLKCIGITWTDWKSTTSSCLYHVLKQAWYKVWIISTVYIDVWAWKQDNKTHLTSLWHMSFWKFIAQAEKNWLTHMIVEVSSHALFQHRVTPLSFVGIWWTNLTREHLDFHWTMDHYAKTKAEIFDKLLPAWVSIVPDDFAYMHLVPHQAATFSRTPPHNASIYVDWLVQDPSLWFTLYLNEESIHIASPLVWSFNCDNMMISAYLASSLWLSLQEIGEWLVSFSWIPWRQELVKVKEWITAMIDFALTPDALETLYTAATWMWYRKIIAVFWATWNRDQWKRPLMWKVASDLCDIVLITEDENYDEEGREIMNAVAQWIWKECFAKVELIQDRAEAIHRWITLAWPWDVVIVTWMANFDSRCMNEWSIPWNEREVIESCFREAGYTLLSDT